MNLLLRSQDRASGETHNYKIKSERILQGIYEVKYITLANTFYNVTTENNEIVYNGGSIFLDVGHYTSNTLPNAIKTLLDGELSDTYTVTISSTTSRLTIASDTTTNFTWDFPDGLNEVLGFPATNAGASSYTGTGVIQTSKLSVGVDILESSHLNVSNYKDDTTGSTLYLPFDENYSVYSTYKDDDLRQYIKFNKPVRNITVQIKDLSTGEILDNHGSEYKILLSQVIRPNPRLN